MQYSNQETLHVQLIAYMTCIFIHYFNMKHIHQYSYLSSLPMATLSCMVSRLAANKAITLLINSWVLDLICCVELSPRVLFSGPIIFGVGFFLYYISFRRQFLSFLNIVPISVLFLNPNMDYDILQGYVFPFMFYVIFLVFLRLWKSLY